MTGRIVQVSSQVYARIGGVRYLVIIANGLLAEVFVRDIDCLLRCGGDC